MSAPRNRPDNPITHRHLLAELVRREFAGKYRGSIGGVFWSLAQPLFLLAVYTLAFGVVLQARWGFSGDTKEYAFMLFAGLIIFQSFSECMTRSPGLILGNPNFVKKVVFPLDLMPWVLALSVMVHALISLGVWILGFMILYGLPHATVFWCPLVLAAFFPLLLGTGWLFAGLGVAFRDLQMLTGMASHALLFLTPVFYGLPAVPAPLRGWMALNPLSFPIEQLRRALWAGSAPDLPGLALYFGATTLFAVVSLAIFRRLRPAFADLV